MNAIKKNLPVCLY